MVEHGIGHYVTFADYKLLRAERDKAVGERDAILDEREGLVRKILRMEDDEDRRIMERTQHLRVESDGWRQRYEEITKHILSGVPFTLPNPAPMYLSKDASVGLLLEKLKVAEAKLARVAGVQRWSVYADMYSGGTEADQESDGTYVLHSDLAAILAESGRGDT